MREETRRRIEALEKQDSKLTRRALLFGAAATLSFAAVWVFPPTVARDVTATVRFAYGDNRDNPRHDTYEIEAELQDGRIVRAQARPLRAPRKGEHIVLRERRYWYGRAYYSWEGQRP